MPGGVPEAPGAPGAPAAGVPHCEQKRMFGVSCAPHWEQKEATALPKPAFLMCHSTLPPKGFFQENHRGTARVYCSYSAPSRLRRCGSSTRITTR